MARGRARAARRRRRRRDDLLARLYRRHDRPLEGRDDRAPLRRQHVDDHLRRLGVAAGHPLSRVDARSPMPAGSTSSRSMMRGGFVRVLPGFDMETFCRTVEAEKINADLSRADDDLCADRRRRHARAARPVLARDDHLRRGADVARPPARGHARFSATSFVQFYGQTEAPQCITTLRKADHDPAPSPAARLVRAAEPAGRGQAVRSRDERGRARRARRNLRARRAGDERILEAPRRDRGRVPRRLAAHRRRRGRGRGRLLDTSSTASRT